MATNSRVIIIWGPEPYLTDRELDKTVASVIAGQNSPPEIARLDPDELTPRELEDSLFEVPLFTHGRVLVIKKPSWLEPPRGRRSRNPGAFETPIIRFLDQEEGMTWLVMVTASQPSGPLAEAVKKKGLVKAAGSSDRTGLENWLDQEAAQRGLSLKPSARSFMAGSGRDMYYLAGELDRLSLCAQGAAVGVEELFIDPDYSGYSIFKLTDAILAKKEKEALEALAAILRKGDRPMPVISMITKEFIFLGKVLSLLDAGLSEREIVDRLNVKSPFRVKKMSRARFRKAGELGPVFSLLGEADRAIKTGYDSRITLETLVVDICRQ